MFKTSDTIITYAESAYLTAEEFRALFRWVASRDESLLTSTVLKVAAQTIENDEARQEEWAERKRCQTSERVRQLRAKKQNTTAKIKDNCEEDENNDKNAPVTRRGVTRVTCVTRVTNPCNASNACNACNASNAPRARVTVPSPSVPIQSIHTDVCDFTHTRADVPALSEVETVATSLMCIPKYYAAWWYRQMVAADWTNTDGSPVDHRNWRPTLRAWHNRAKPGELEQARRESMSPDRAAGRTYGPDEWSLCAERCAHCTGTACGQGEKTPPQARKRPQPPEECPKFAARMPETPPEARRTRENGPTSAPTGRNDEISAGRLKTSLRAVLDGPTHPDAVRVDVEPP